MTPCGESPKFWQSSALSGEYARSIAVHGVYPSTALPSQDWCSAFPKILVILISCQNLVVSQRGIMLTQFFSEVLTKIYRI